MKTKSQRLTTERLVLKALEDGDKEALLGMAADSQIKKTYMLPDFENQAQADAFFQRLRDLCALEQRFIYGIYLKDELIGFLNDCEIDGSGIELGYFISSAHWNHGYATEALGAAIRELFRMGFDRVTAGYFEENPASSRVMEKCGMGPLQRESSIPYRGISHHCLYREIRREDKENTNCGTEEQHEKMV